MRSLIVILLMMSSWAIAEPLRVFTTSFAPYSYLEGDELKGLSVEVVEKALELAEIEHSQFEVYPWSRTYTLAQHHPNSLIFSISRIPEREELFVWAGKIAPYKVNLYALSTREDIQIEALDDAKNYVVVGEFKDVKQQYLVSQGFTEGKNLVLASDSKIGSGMLMHGRVDLIPFSAFAIDAMLIEHGYDPRSVKSVFPLEDISYELYAAFNKDTDENTVKAFSAALESLHQTGWMATKWLEFEQEFGSF